MVALLHDFDYEIHPTLDQHPQDGAADPPRGGLPRGRHRGRALTRRASVDAPGHAPQEDALRLRRALRLRPRVWARPPDRPRRSRAQVGEEEAQPAVVRGRRPSRRGVRRGRGPRARARRPHSQRRRGDAADRGPSSACARRRRRRPRDPQLDFFGVVVSDMARSSRSTGCSASTFPRAPEHERHVEAPLPGGMRYALDTEDVMTLVRRRMAAADGRATPRAARSAANRRRRSTGSTPSSSVPAAGSTRSRGTRSGASATRS